MHSNEENNTVIDEAGSKMDEKKVNESGKIDDNHKENKDLILKLDKQVALGLWIQVIGQVIESTALSQLLVLNDDPHDPDLENEEKIVLGAWIQTIGQLLEAIGVSEQIPVKDGIEETDIIIVGQKIAIAGDWLQGFGALLEAIAGTNILTREQISSIIEKHVIP